MLKLIFICTLSMVTITGCEQQKNASAEVGTVPKQIIDKATQDINNAQALATENLKALEQLDAPTEAQQ
ncbi:MAG TPA: hypothetical protein PKL42_00200 [Methylotenera sp.]|nr:hypothetical protein [Methylotenera sp.]HPV31273.1 hypothetical protein [Methylotenera sp.]